MPSLLDVQHLRKKDEAAKPAERAGRGRKTHTVKKKFHKGSPSKTHPGDKDFTTKKTSKYFDRKGKRYSHAEGSFIERLPYHVERIFGIKMTKSTKKATKKAAKKGKKANKTMRKSRK